MKRVLFSAVFLIISGLCFGQIILSNSAYAESNLHMNTEISSGYYFYNIKNDDSYTMNYGVPIQFLWNVYGEKLGMEMYVNGVILTETILVSPPDSMKIENRDQQQLMYFELLGLPSSYIRMDTSRVQLHQLEFFIGVLFKLVDTKRIKVPLSVGLHFNFFGISLQGSLRSSGVILSPYPTFEMEYFEFNSGLGFNISLQCYLLDNFYLFGRIQTAFDFINYTEAEFKIRQYASVTVSDSEVNQGLSSAWGFSPQLGFGFRY